jgi:hypothetical protein
MSFSQGKITAGISSHFKCPITHLDPNENGHRLVSASTKLCKTERIEDEHELYLVASSERNYSTVHVARIEGAAGRHSRRSRGKTASEHAATADFKFV